MGNKVYAWHFVGETLRDGRPVPANGVKLKHGRKPKICYHGFHASKDPFDALYYAPGNTLCLVEMSGDMEFQDDKMVASERSIIHRIDATNILRKFARQAALNVIHLWKAPTVVIQYLQTGDENLRAAAWAAAGDAARDAAGDAARDAARAAGDAARAARDAARAAGDAARDAARAAAGAAAWAAAGDAARDAAGAAARAAARAAAGAAARAAAGDAARAAAGAAAWAAAGDAARAAARAAGAAEKQKQRQQFNDLVNSEFQQFLDNLN